MYFVKAEKVTIFSYHISNQPNKMWRINLLLISEDIDAEKKRRKKQNITTVGLKNLCGLLNNQKHEQKKNYFCDRCLYDFTQDNLLTNHKEDSVSINKSSTQIEMPSKAEHIKFKNHKIKYLFHMSYMLIS